VLVNWGCPQDRVLSPLLWNMGVDVLLRRLHNAHYQAQGYADDVVLLQKGKFASTLCDRMQGSLNCVENSCREICLSADKTTMVLFMNNRMIGGFYNPRLFGTELRMTDQVKYLGVIWDKRLDWKAYLENWRILHIGSVVMLCERLGIITKGGGLAIHFRGEAHSFVCFAGMVEESEAEKCLEKALSLKADDVFGNYWR
jgi:hypothetical protein